MPDHNLSKLYLLSTPAYKEYSAKKQNNVEEKKMKKQKIPKKECWMKKKDPISKWNEKNRELQMKLMSKLKKHRQMNDKEFDDEIEKVPKKIIHPPITPRKLDIADEIPEKATPIQSPVVRTKMTPKTITPLHTRLADKDSRPYYGFIPGDPQKKILVARTPVPKRNQKGKGKSFNWITIN